MIDLVGNITIQNETRYKYFLATLKSFDFIKHECSIFLNIENSKYNKEEIVDILKEWNGFFLQEQSGDFGKIYLNLLRMGNNSNVLHFEEDHFCQLNDISILKDILQASKNTNCSIIKASFFDIENNSFANCIPSALTQMGNAYLLDQENYSLSHKYYKYRYYLGNNSIFERNFAQYYWSRPYVTKRPHDFEIKNYHPRYVHSVFIPAFEILRSIDDDHGEPNTCMLKNPTEKWYKLFN